MASFRLHPFLALIITILVVGAIFLSSQTFSNQEVTPAVHVEPKSLAQEILEIVIVLIAIASLFQIVLSRQFRSFFRSMTNNGSDTVTIRGINGIEQAIDDEGIITITIPLEDSQDSPLPKICIGDGALKVTLGENKFYERTLSRNYGNRIIQKDSSITIVLTPS